MAHANAPNCVAPYNDKLDADTQICMEEAIAATIFESVEISEDDAAELGRQILKLVLFAFRPDLFEDGSIG